MVGTELLLGKEFAPPVFPAWVNSLALHLHEEAAFSRSRPGIANHPNKQKHGAQCRMGQLSAVPGKHTKLGTKEQLKLHGKNEAWVFLDRQYSEMYCCSAFILLVCNSSCLKYTTHYFTVEDVSFSMALSH